MLNNPGNPLLEWNMSSIQTWFSGDGKTLQYWIVGSSNVGKTYNIDTLEGSSYRAYLMSKYKKMTGLIIMISIMILCIMKRLVPIIR
jgi:hypothetical protein